MKHLLLAFLCCFPVFAEEGLEKFIENFDVEMAQVIGNEDYLDELKVSLGALKKENRFAPSRVIVAYGPRGNEKVHPPLLLQEALQRKSREGERVYGPGYEVFLIDGSKFRSSREHESPPIAKYHEKMGVLKKKIQEGIRPIILIGNLGYADPPVRRELLQINEEVSNALIVMTLESSDELDFEAYYLRTFGIADDSRAKGLARLKYFHPVLVKNPTRKSSLVKFAKRYVRDRVEVGQFRKDLSEEELKQLIDKVVENGQYDRHGTLALIRAIQVKLRK